MTDPKPIRVMIVDDHPIVRDGLKTLVAAYKDLELAGEAANGQQALRQCAEQQPDVILVDLVMPGMDGPTTIQKILKQQPHVKVVALTSFPEKDLVQEALAAGAISYLLKNSDTDTLVGAIRAAYADHSTLAPEATEALMQTTVGSTHVGYDLSEREKEVLALIVQGFSNEKIAERLVISLPTVKHHVSACIAKLAANNRAHAAALAVQYRLVPAPE
ncbi:MAG: LuxR family transcriptional regulator [Anaerolineae bacterium SG8_19]|jgi:NarL family two-component system response regulator LiaR|nr:MAG: LuxR family transcriptional regulator [Anaerolineae bacterium SG8_19]